jgi:hypothetical protein
LLPVVKVEERAAEVEESKNGEETRDTGEIGLLEEDA